MHSVEIDRMSPTHTRSTLPTTKSRSKSDWVCPLKVCATRIIWFVAISSCMCSICLADGTHTHTVVVVVSLEWTRNRYRNGLLLLWLFVESQMSNIKWSEKDKRAHFSNSHCTISSTCMCIYCLSVFRLCSPSAFGVIYLVPLTVAASPLDFSKKYGPITLCD